jgi:hypothetical protein
MSTLISNAIQMGVNEPQYTWIKGLESETDDKFRLILGSYDSSISKNKLIEISPDKSIRFFGSVIMNQFTMSPGSLNGNSIQNGTISSDKLQSGITITGSLIGKADQASKDGNGNVINTYYAPKTELSKYLLKTDNAVSATKAVQDGNGNNIVNTYATKAELNVKVPIANPTFTGTVTGTFKGNVTGNASSATKATQDASGRVITTTYATKTELNGKISTTGNRGTISGYETCGSASTINQDSPNFNVTGETITVQDGTNNTCWTKTIRCTAASPVVNLGSKWVWAGGTTPTLKQNGILVCAWLGNEGIISFVSKN